MKIIGFIPARYGSTRFPGKPLSLINGVPMVVRVYRQAKKCKELEEVVILTDSKLIYDTAIKYDCNVMITSKECKNGTERILEVYRGFKGIDGFINIQGDEPLIRPEHLELICKGIRNKYRVTTLVKEVMGDWEELHNPNTVKVAIGINGKALYFSRSRIPYHRETTSFHYYKHIGVYGFTKDALNLIGTITDSRLEEVEKLEQLRWLENGIDIYTYETEFDVIGVDTKKDLEKIIKHVDIRNED